MDAAPAGCPAPGSPVRAQAAECCAAGADAVEVCRDPAVETPAAAVAALASPARGAALAVASLTAPSAPGAGRKNKDPGRKTPVLEAASTRRSPREKRPRCEDAAVLDEELPPTARRARAASGGSDAPVAEAEDGELNVQDAEPEALDEEELPVAEEPVEDEEVAIGKRRRRKKPKALEEEELPAADEPVEDEDGESFPPAGKKRRKKPKAELPSPEKCDEAPEDVRQRSPPRRQASNDSAEDAAGDTDDVFAKLRECRCQLARALVKVAQGERREARERLQRDGRRLGRYRAVLMGDAGRGDPAAAVQWEGGTEAEDIERLRAHIAEQKLAIERMRKSTSRPRLRTPAEGKPPGTEEAEEALWEHRELCSSRLAAVNREEAVLREREQRLRVDRLEHLRREKVSQAEDQAEYADFPLLRGRYQLLRLIGRSRRTEAYRAHDLGMLRPCAVKLHRCAGASPEQREARLGALMRDCETLRRLRHQRVAALMDHFPLEGGGAVATVWEFCEGDTLEAHLRRHGPLPEKEARGVALQVLSALRCVEAVGEALRGARLKPSRLVLRGGEAKIVGLGLPRASGGSSGSTVAGPYAPPDCYESQGDGAAGSEAPVVDVWAAGAILYEMLFGELPSLLDGSGAEAGSACVRLPDQPKISAECKDFLRRVLDRDRRPTVEEACCDPFVRRQR